MAGFKVITEATQDATKFGSATVTVATPPTITSVSVACTPTSIQTGQTSQCTATVIGTGSYSSAVTWSATNGSITSAGVFTPTAAGAATITASSTQDTTKSGSASVTVTVPVTITSVSASCSPASITTDQTSICTAFVTGTGNYSSGVTWSVSPTSIGAVSSADIFTPTASGTATITATSTQDTTKTGTTSITVTVAVPAALAIYDMRAASSTQATDTTGNGNHCVFGSGTNAPTLANGTLSFNGANQQYCTTPISRADAQTIVMAVRIPIVNTTPLVPTLWSSTDNTCPTTASFAPPGWFAVSGGIIDVWYPGVSTTYFTEPRPGEVESPIPGYAIIAQVVGSSQDQWYINGQPVNWRNGYSASTTGCNTGNLLIGANLGSVNIGIPASDYALTGDISAVGIWRSALTAGQVASVSSAFAATNDAKGYVPAPQYTPQNQSYAYVHTILDSRTWGGNSGAGGMPYYESLPALLNNPTGSTSPPLTYTWEADTEAEPAQDMCQAADRVGIYLALYDPYAVHNAIVVWGIFNDPESVDVSESCTAALTKQLKQTGYDVFVATEIDAMGSGWETTKLAYNNWLKANWQQIGAVGVVDLGENPNIGCDGCYTNTTYFNADGVHPNTLSDTTIIAPYVAAAMNAYYGSGESANVIAPNRPAVAAPLAPAI